jgi:hypothetical protein
MPTWGGTAGASGTGATKQITFNTVSQNTTDYKTVIAGNPTAVTVNVVVYELTGTLTPQYNFTGRSQDIYGLKENVDLNFTANPGISQQQIGNLQWKIISGQGTLLNNSTNGINTYSAPQTVGDLTLKLELLDGPSKTLGPSYNKTIIAPSNGAIRQHPLDNTIWHCQGFCSAGFYAEIRIEPKDVSFSNLFFREGFVRPAKATGYYSNFRNHNHDPTAVLLRMTNCNSITGCQALEDRVWTSRGSPPFSFGEFEWRIPWRYAFNDDLDPTFNGETTFDIGVHNQIADVNGTATIRKNQAGPFSAVVNAGNQNCLPY